MTSVLFKSFKKIKLLSCDRAKTKFEFVKRNLPIFVSNGGIFFDDYFVFFLDDSFIGNLSKRKNKIDDVQRWEKEKNLASQEKWTWAKLKAQNIYCIYQKKSSKNFLKLLVFLNNCMCFTKDFLFEKLKIGVFSWLFSNHTTSRLIFCLGPFRACQILHSDIIAKSN